MTATPQPPSRSKIYRPETAQCTTESVPGPWDAIVIGSGLGGLVVAAALSKSGKRVLVLERHYEVGGFTHVFRRRHYAWDVGVHYVPNFGPPHDSFYQITGLTDGKLQWERMTGVIDRLMFPGLTVDMHSDIEKYIDTLSEHFPNERDGLAQYFAYMAKVGTRMRPFYTASAVPFRPLIKLLRNTYGKTGWRASQETTEEVMKRYLKDPRLMDIIDAQALNIGVFRNKSSFLVHSAMLHGYLNLGGYYPVGGATAIPREFSRVIHEAGGAVRIRAEVDEVIVRGGKTVGVRLADGEEILSNTVVSDIGAPNTYNKLLRNEHSSKVERNRTEISTLEPSVEFVNLFLGVDDPAALNVGKENYWIYREYPSEGNRNLWDLEDMEREGEPLVMFAGFPSMRDPEHGRGGKAGHTAQIIFAMEQQGFERFRGSKWNKRGQSYDELKAEISERVLAAVEKRIPGLRDQVKVQETATPLTFEHFSNHVRGAPYGIKATPERYRVESLIPWTPVRGLYLTGQDIICPGVIAAFGSGVLTASVILRGYAGKRFSQMGRAIAGDA